MTEKTFQFNPLYSGGMLTVKDHDLPVILDISGGTLQPCECWLMHVAAQKVGRIEQVWVGKNTDGTPNVCASGYFDTDADGTPTPCAREVIAQKNLYGKSWEGSIHTYRVLPPDLELLPPGQEVEINGKKFVGPAEIVRRWKILEGSFVGMGADSYNGTEICAISNAAPLEKTDAENKKGQAMPKELKDYIIALGFVPEDLTAEAIGILERAFKAQQEALASAQVAAEGECAPTPPGEKKPEEGGVAAEGEPAPTPPGEKKPEEGGVAASAFRRYKNPASNLSTGGVDKKPGAPTLNRAWTAALLLNSGIMAPAEVAAAGKFNDNEMSAAMTGRFTGAGWKQMLAEAQERRTGLRVTGNEAGFAMDALKRLMNPGEIVAGAAFSTMDELKIIQNVLSLFYRAGYESFVSVVDKIATVTYADNFFPYKYVSYDVRDAAAATPEGDEIPSTTLVSEEFENQVGEKASLLTITERVIINDSTGAIGKLARKLGIRQKRQRDAKGMKCILDSLTTFFTTARGNRVTNTLGIAGLNAAAKALAEMPTLGSTTEDPDFTGEIGKMLLVPTALFPTAQTLYHDTKCDLIGLGDHLQSNPHVGLYEPVPTPYIGAKVTSGSDTHAILLGDIANGSILDMARLRGETGARIEEVPAPANIVGKCYRTIDRYGFAMGDYRAGVLLDGTAA